MGCDIHMIAEVHKGGLWQFVPGPIIPCWGCGGSGMNAGDDNTEPCRWCTNEFDSYIDDEGVRHTHRIRTYAGPGKMRDNWFSDRNYSVFSHLADVRNNGSIQPIALPRGFPDDMSAEAKEWMENYGGDHSDSWLNLMEISAHNWTISRTVEGVVDLDEYRTFKAKGKPEAWAGAVSPGRGAEMVSNAEMDSALMGKTCGFKHCVNPAHDVTSTRLFTAITWTTRAADECRDFLDRMQMLQDKTKAPPQRLRLIFNFDS